MTLFEFLHKADVTGVTEEVIISKRLKDMPFKIKALTMEEISEIRNSASHSSSKEMGIAVIARELILSSLIEPNFRDVNTLQEFGLRTPEDCVRKFLLAGEQEYLVRKINKLSGFKKETELVVEAKN